MDELDGMKFDGYTINYEMVVESKQSLPVTRSLASKLMKTPYMTLGDFIMGLSGADLDTLMEIANSDEDERFEDVILITQMLAEAEGLETTFGTDELALRTSMFGKYLIIESLHRKGLVKMHHENLSFGDDMGDRIVVEKIND
jgi:hypothetical protein